MAVPKINHLPPAPVRTDAPEDFSDKADDFVDAMEPFGQEANTLAYFVDARATAALASETLATSYAVRTDDYADGANNSSKSWAIGGTGNGQPEAGAARDWAIALGLIGGLDYSAKSHASGTVPLGSAKQWATQAAIVDGDYSAKAYAAGTVPTGAAKDWALKDGEVVTGQHSAQTWAMRTTPQGSAKQWAVAAEIVDGDYSAKAYANSGDTVPEGSAREWATKTGGMVAGLERSAKAYAQDAEMSAVAAAGASNFKGRWSDLTGPLAAPATVFHDGTTWALLDSLPDVTAAEPGVSPSWASSNTVPFGLITGDPYDNDALTVALNAKLDASAMSATVSMYQTTSDSDKPGFLRLTTDVHDPDFDATEQEVTFTITGTNQLLASYIADAGAVVGHIDDINVTTLGRARVTQGRSTVFFRVYLIAADNTETLIAESGESVEIRNETFEEIHCTALIPHIDPSSTDRIAVKFFGNKISAGAQSVVRVMVGGTRPMRTYFPVPVANLNLIPTISYGDRGTLRLRAAPGDALVLVDGLGLFRLALGSDEPDDDESCFVTAVGAWLLECPHWDVVNDWQLPDDSERDDRAESIEDAVFAEGEKSVIHGIAKCAIATVAGVTSASFTGDIAGAAVGDTVIAVPPAQIGAAAADSGRLSYYAYISEPSKVTVVIVNASAAEASIATGAQADWSITVFKEV